MIEVRPYNQTETYPHGALTDIVVFLFVRPTYRKVGGGRNLVKHDCTVAYSRPYDYIVTFLRGTNKNIEVFALYNDHSIALSVGKEEKAPSSSECSMVL